MVSLINPFFLLFVSFIGIYLNVWFLLLTFKHKSQLHERKKPKRLPPVSVLMPVYNGAKTIGKCLKSVLSLDYPANKLEVIVVDNGSTDGTSNIVKKVMRKFRGAKRRVKLITLPKPGKVDALNVGLRQAKGEIIGVLDDDTFVSKSCLKEMIGFFDDENIGAVTNHIKVANAGGLLGILQNIEYIFSALTKRLFNFLNAVYTTPGTLSLLRKDIIEVVGFSDDTLAEDMDVALYITKKNYKIVNCLSAVSHTIVPKKLGELLKQRVRWYRGFIENVRKHSDLLFNREHVHLGWFIFPFASFMAVFVGVALTVLLVLNRFRNSTMFLKELIYIPLIDKMGLMMSDFLKPINFFIEPYSIIAYSTILIGSFITLLVTFHFLGVKKSKKLILIPFYFFLYYSLLMVFWLVSIIMEIFNIKKKW